MIFQGDKYNKNKLVIMTFENLSITFHTNKIKECINFYSKHFQAVVVYDSEWYVVIRLESGINASPLYLSFQGDSEYYDRTYFSGGVSLNLQTIDVDASYNQIKQSGISFIEELTNHEWGDKAFSIKDPIGNLLYIYSEREASDK